MLWSRRGHNINKMRKSSFLLVGWVEVRNPTQALMTLGFTSLNANLQKIEVIKSFVSQPAYPYFDLE